FDALQGAPERGPQGPAPDAAGKGPAPSRGPVAGSQAAGHQLIAPWQPPTWRTSPTMEHRFISITGTGETATAAPGNGRRADPVALPGSEAGSDHADFEILICRRSGWIAVDWRELY